MTDPVKGMLREALVKLVGVDGREDLVKMKELINLYAPLDTKDALLNAVYVLLVTLPQQEK